MNRGKSTILGKEDSINFSDYDFDYDYPNGLDLHPDGEQHRKLLDVVLECAQESYNTISERFPTWAELDEKLTVYIDLSKEETEVQGKDKTKPVAMVVPVTYATREALLTYWVATFMRHPLFKYETGNDPADLLGVIMLEALIQQDMIRSKGGLELYTHWSDGFTYGFGAISPGWKREMGFRTRRIEVPGEMSLGATMNRKSVKEREQIVKFEGNELITLDPYNCLPDPNFPIHRVKDMDFFGWTDRTNKNALLSDEQLSEGNLFNCKFVNIYPSAVSKFYSADDNDTGRYTKTGITFNAHGNSRNVDIVNMYKWIIPVDLGLGDSEYPELWHFKIAGDRIIIACQPLDLDHNEIPVCTMAPNTDGHTTIPVSVLEREYPLQHAIDWLWKSHVGNVRKSLNNMLVVDPSLINMEDLTDTKFGMVARLRASAWGRGVNDAVQQLKVEDITRNHVVDIGFLMNVDSMVFTPAQAKGVQERKGERVSSQEARDTRMSFLTRMEKDGKLAAMQSHYDIAYQLASNTIQLMEDEKFVKITGEYKQVLQEEFGQDATHYKIDPRALDIRYDVVPNDGSIPGGEFADTWVQLMNNAAAHPDIYQSLDFTRIWLHIARLLGAKNPSDFMKTPAVANQEEIDKGVQAGNIVPAKQMNERSDFVQ